MRKGQFAVYQAGKLRLLSKRLIWQKRYLSIRSCTKATNTSSVIALNINISQFSEIFLQTYKSYRFERFLFSSVHDIPVVLTSNFSFMVHFWKTIRLLFLTFYCVSSGGVLYYFSRAIFFIELPPSINRHFSNNSPFLV